jgi:hypothetical protein
MAKAKPEATPAPVAAKKTTKPGTALAVKAAANVVDISKAIAAQAASMGERTAPPSGSAIRVKGKQFTLPDGQVCDTMDVVIADFRATHDFYEGAFDPKNISPPICFAIAVNPKDAAPSKSSPKMQCDTCGPCPMNQFGSDGNGKACKEGRKLALLPLNDAGDDVDAEADMWTLKVSPTALKGFDGFVQSVVRTFNTPPVGVIVSVGFDEGVDYPKLTFTNPRPYTNVAAAFARQGEAKDMLEAEPDVSGYSDQPAKRGAPAKKAVGARR